MKKIALVVCTILNLSISASLGFLFIQQLTFFIISNIIATIACFLNLKKYKNQIIQKPVNAFCVIASLMLIAGFYILLVNVVVMEIGNKACEKCGVATTFGIILACLYLSFYLFLLVVAIIAFNFSDRSIFKSF